MNQSSPLSAKAYLVGLFKENHCYLPKNFTMKINFLALLNLQQFEKP